MKHKLVINVSYSVSISFALMGDSIYTANPIREKQFRTRSVDEKLHQEHQVFFAFFFFLSFFSSI